MNRRWWKAYFFFALAITLFGLVFLLFLDDERQLTWWEWVYIPLYSAQIVGLFGFVFWRRIAAPTLWQLIFFVSVAYELWNLYTMTTDLEFVSEHAAFVTSMVVVTLLMQIPLLIGLFFYGFRSRELWHGAT